MLFAMPALAADDVAAQLAAKLGVNPKDVAPSPIPGLYSVVLGVQVAYVTADGRYLLRGDILDRQDGKNLSAGQRNAARLAYIDSIGEQNMIVFAPPHPKHVLTVLTDIDCAYCRQLAVDMPQLMAMGVELRYIAFPRTGVDSPSWDKAVAVWCAKNRQVAYQYAMRGADVGEGKCDPAPVAAGYEFAQKLGVDGTPVMINEYGQLIDGYVPPEQLVRLLDDQDSMAAEAN
ncbi:MAG TPA: DsbC family protein [Gammaproteobacteria bacterium]|nr:DsbC family protein [Gammaproteobacteria bacterium]